VPERSIYAQIDEIRDVLEKRELRVSSLRGHMASEEEEHILRLKCTLRTLEWVRDHKDQLRTFARQLNFPAGLTGSDS
jgi:hypothetical protein